MAQDGYDTLLNLTDSRYRLSRIVANRAAQLKTGARPLLEEDALPEAAANTVSVAMAELVAGVDLEWGDDLPSEPALDAARAVRQPKEPEDPYAV